MYKINNQKINFSNLIEFLCFLFASLLIYTIFINDLVGFVSLFLVISFTLILGKIYPAVKIILIVGLTIRLFVLFLGNIFELPDSGKDAVAFEYYAINFAKGGFLNVITNHLPAGTSKTLSWIIAIFYSLFGRSLLMVQSFSLLFGIGTIFLGWMITKKLWDQDKALKVGWVLAFFPSLILYSTLFMRETYIAFFLLLALLGVINWTRDKSLKSISLAMLGFFCATFLHGAMAIGGIIFLFFVGFNSLKFFFRSIFNGRINYKNLIVIILIFTFFYGYFTNKIEIPKIGTFKNSTNISNLTKIMNLASQGNAKYPQWLIINSTSEFLYKAPVRTLYFLFSPLPWQIKKINHLIGLFDSFLYMILFYLIIQNRKVIWKDPAFRIILIILICYFFVYAIGVGNFGTGLRHRSKFVAILILLAVPFLPKFVHSIKKK
tara:strand:+ start:2212 stop:3513 length:1302 start_codon:yes stop_codon:yes gene_type:complete